MTMVSAKGRQGAISFDGAFVTIQREGAVARLTFGKGEKRIPIGAVQAVQWKPFSLMGWGFIQVTVAGGAENRSKRGRASKDAHEDENSVTFSKRAEPEMRRVYDAINAALAGRYAQPSGPVGPSPDIGSRIGELAKLHSAGSLTDDEFATAKRQLLGG